MNVLILTPGRTGSSLLQRLITIHMLHDDKSVINLHDLLYGLDNKNPDHQDFSESMPEVIGALEKVDYYKVARVAYKGILKRNDSAIDQTKFYKYINDNFYIIRSERTDLLEFALSWIIVNYSKKRNVHSHDEKASTFTNINSIRVGKQKLFELFNLYKDYIEWSDNHFNIQSIFNYEESINDIETYVSSLEFINNSWTDMFGMSFNEWNKHHSEFSDNELYKESHAQINKFVEDGSIPTHLTIKLHSFEEKKQLVENFDQCVKWYNEWVNAQYVHGS